MPLEHDEPSIERDPETHDREAIEAGSTERDRSAIQTLLERHRAPAGPLLDLTCGTGRHLRALAASGHRVVGVDVDERMTAECTAVGVPTGCRVVTADASALALPERFGAALLLNRSLVCFHSHRQAWGLFTSVTNHLLPGGLFLIHDVCRELWREVAAGTYADGLSEDGSQQLAFVDGEHRFTWRRGTDVDPAADRPRPGERLYRLWSVGEVALAAAGAGLELTDLAGDSGYLVLRSP